MTTWVAYGGDDVEVRSTGLGGSPLLVPGATIGLYLDAGAATPAASPADIRVVGGGTLTLPLTVNTVSQVPVFEARDDATLYYRVNGGPIARLYQNTGPQVSALSALIAGKVSKSSLFYDVTDAGAVHDGTTDDTTAIHTARDAAGVGGRVYFPPGTYVVKNLRASLNGQTWLLHPQAVLKLASSALATDDMLRATATADVTIEDGQWDFTASPSRTHMVYTTSCDGFTIRNIFRMTGPATAGDWYGLSAVNVSNVRFTNNRLRNACIFVQNSVAASSGIIKTDVRITGNTVDYTGNTNSYVTGITVRGEITVTSSITNVHVDDNTVLGPMRTVNNNNAGIALWRCFNVTCNDNTVDGWCFGITNPRCSDMTVADNTVRNFCAYGIELPLAIGVTVSGGTLDPGTVGAGLTAGTVSGIAVEGGDASEVIISGVLFQNYASQFGIFTGSGGTDRNIHVTGCIFKMTGASQAWRANGLVQNCSFIANDVEMDADAASAAVYVSAGGFDGLTMVANTLKSVNTGLKVAISSGNIDNLLMTANRPQTVTNLRTFTLTGSATKGTNLRIVGNTVPGVDETTIRTKAGAPVDADYDGVVDGLLALDTTAVRINARVGGVWTPVSTSPFEQYQTSLLATGEETVPRQVVPFGTYYTPAPTGEVRGAQFVARKTQTITQVRVITGNTAAAATPTLCKLGVYTVDASGNLTLVASTASDTTLFAAASTTYTRSFVASFTKTAGVRYSVVVLVVTAGTAPNFQGLGASTENGILPMLATRLTAQTDLPASITVGTLATNCAPIYAVLLP